MLEQVFMILLIPLVFLVFVIANPAGWGLRSSDKIQRGQALVRGGAQRRSAKVEEAKFSLNVRFNLGGYDCQYTARSDDAGINLLRGAPKLMELLTEIGATAERRWEARNSKEKDQPKSAEPAAGAERRPTAPDQVIREARDLHTTGVIAVDELAACPLCGVVGRLELIGFMRGSQYRQAWKCQACQSWLPNGSK